MTDSAAPEGLRRSPRDTSLCTMDMLVAGARGDVPTYRLRVDGLTADLAGARAVSEEVGRLLDARDEVEAQLSRPTVR